MRKIVSLLLALVMCLGLSGCSKTYTGYDGLVEKARKEIPISEADTTEIKIAGSIDMEDGTCLIWFITGDEYQAHYYAPIEFKQVKKNDDKYQFIHTYKPAMSGEDIAFLNWKQGKAFLINNAECTGVEIYDNDGTQTVVPVESYPCFFYWETIPSEFIFLDANGKTIG